MKAVAFNRFYLTNPPDAQVHFYSTGMSVPAGWVFEGVEGYVSPIQRNYTVPFYRFYSGINIDHVYTVSEVERASLKNPAVYYTDEGIAGYVLKPEQDIPGTVPLYRFVRAHKANNYHDDGSFKAKGGFEGVYQDHFYSLNATVPAYYSSEGIAARVWKDPVMLPDALLQITSHGSGDKWIKGSVQKIGWMVWTGSGLMRLSYSSDNRQSWSIIADVPVSQNYGVMVSGSYDWKLPANLLGKIFLKIDWVKSPGSGLFGGLAQTGMAMPWASVQSRDIEVVTFIPINRQLQTR